MQSLSPVAPSIAEYFPLGQSWHVALEVMPSPLLHVPAPHGVQAATSPAPVSEDQRPAPHATHPALSDPAPSIAPYLPAAQAVHVVEAVAAVAVE
jgi:hypothetical protein